jgi:hypothetical protein
MHITTATPAPIFRTIGLFSDLYFSHLSPLNLNTRKKATSPEREAAFFLVYGLYENTFV